MTRTADTQRLAALGILGLLAGWAFLPTLIWMAGKWADDPQYSHGFLVPLFAGYLVWRKGFSTLLGGRPAPVLAGLVLAVALLFRWVGGKLLLNQLDAAALLLTLSGIALAVGGRPLARGTAGAVLFLVFMVPLPYEMERNLGGPLKMVATEASTYLLQTLGYPAVAEGNRILIDEHTLGVEDACSGLKMLVTFSAFAAGAVLMLDRTFFEKAMVVLGVVPIAVFTNVLRVTATGVTYTMVSDPDARHFTHDLYGWLMMPAGLGLLALQLWCLTRLVVRPAADYVPLAPVRLVPAY